MNNTQNIPMNQDGIDLLNAQKGVIDAQKVLSDLTHVQKVNQITTSIARIQVAMQNEKTPLVTP